MKWFITSAFARIFFYISIFWIAKNKIIITTKQKQRRERVCVRDKTKKNR